MQKIGVIGLGLNGLISAIAMKVAGFEVVAFESENREFLATDSRTSALTFETIEFFKELKLYEQIANFIAPINHIYTFEGNEKPILEFDANEVSQNPFGFVIHNSKLKEVLLKRFDALQIPIVSTKIIQINCEESFAKISLETDEEIKVKLVLNCSGKTSKIIKGLEFKSKIFDYNQTAFVFNISHELYHKNIAIESFSSGGPIAILPLISPLNSAVIWTVRTETADYLKTLSESEFLNTFKNIAARMKHIGNIETLTKVKSYPLSLSFNASQIHERVFSLGDSFNSIHPVAGQAFNMSLKDTKNLYSEGKNAITLGLDIGGKTMLSSVARKNLKHHIEMNLFTHFLVNIF